MLVSSVLLLWITVYIENKEYCFKTVELLFFSLNVKGTENKIIKTDP